MEFHYFLTRVKHSTGTFLDPATGFTESSLFVVKIALFSWFL